MDQHDLPQLPEKFDPSHYAGRAEKYVSAARLFFGVRLSTEDHQRLTQLLAFAQSVDTYIDSPQTGRVKEHIAQVNKLLDQPAAVGMQYSALSAEALGQASYDHVFGLFRKVMNFALPLRQTPTLQRYIALRRLEGRYYAHLLTASLTTATQRQKGYPALQRWLPALGEIGNLRDSYNDLAEDYARGEHSFAPTPQHRRQLVGHIALAIMRARRQAHRPEFSPILAPLPPSSDRS